MGRTVQWTQNRKEKLQKAGEACFYLGLLLEILIVILDKSSWINPVEGQMFRISFLLFALKLSLTEYTRREWAAILFAGLVAGICYLCSTRDEAVRFVVFAAAMKGIDHRKVMKTVFWTTLAGLAVLAALAFAGVLGEVWDAGAGYGSKEGVARLCLGVGNSNALACMVWALMTLGLYLWQEKLKIWHFALLYLLTWLTYTATRTRTALLVMAATLALAALLTYGKKLRQAAWVYLAGIGAVLAGVAFSVYAAYISDWYEFLPEWVVKIDRILTGRITSIYAFENGGGVLENWKLFGAPQYTEYFDMGYVRLFFWYGILPGICCVLAICWLLWECRKQKDPMGFVLVLSFALYTVIEAHAVSVYIGRNYALLLMGAYWTAGVAGIGGKSLKKPEPSAYWWSFPKLLKREGK